MKSAVVEATCYEFWAIKLSHGAAKLFQSIVCVILDLLCFTFVFRSGCFASLMNLFSHYNI